MSAPRVTVLTAVHNGEAYLAEAIESVLAQTCPDFELLLVDDGSTDRSREIARSYADPRIRILENERNVGLARSLNRGLAEARGALVARLDADDVCEPERLARQVAFLDAHPDVALLGSGYTEIDAQGRPGRVLRLPTAHADLCWALLFYCPFVHSAAMIRKDAVLGAVGPYDETLSYSMDYELWRRIARRLRVANLPEPLVRYRLSPSSMTLTYGSRTREGRLLAETTVGELLGWAGDPADRWALLRAVVHVPPVPLRAAEARWARDEVYRLHERFCGFFGLTGDECEGRRQRLADEVSRRLVEAVRQFPSAYTLREGAHLLATSVRERPTALVTRAGAAAAVKLLGFAATRHVRSGKSHEAS